MKRQRRYILAIGLVVSFMAGETDCSAQADVPASNFSLRVESQLERTALNYNLLLVDTTSLSIDSLEQLQKSADIRTEPSMGVRTIYLGRNWDLDNGVYYSHSGWRNQFDGRGRISVSDIFGVRTNARFDYRQEDNEEDSLLSGYWDLAGDVRLLAAVSPTHTAFVRTDAEWLRYVDDVPGIGYDYNRLRSRVGWRWQSADFDFVEVAAGIGRRTVPDSTEREYAERFATFYSDIGAGDRHRLSLDLHIDAKDYKSNDPRDDYTFSAAEARWDYRPRLSWLLSAWVRWDFWDFRAEDEVTSDFHEIEPTVEAKIPLGTSWAARLGMRYRAMFSPNSESLQANYGQPSAICGLEYMPFVPVWTDLRAEIGYRDYEEGVLGYSDFTLVKIDLSGTADIADRWSFLAAVNYEIEVHAVEQDDTDFLYFSFRLAYHLMH